jgi:hypothetical protein
MFTPAKGLFDHKKQRKKKPAASGLWNGRMARQASSHGDGDKGQQKHQQRAHQRNHYGDVGHDGFNGVFFGGGVVLRGRHGLFPKVSKINPILAARKSAWVVVAWHTLLPSTAPQTSIAPNRAIRAPAPRPCQPQRCLANLTSLHPGGKVFSQGVLQGALGGRRISVQTAEKSVSFGDTSVVNSYGY